MKKISSKIIISLVLATVLWGGGVDFPTTVSADDRDIPQEVILDEATWIAQHTTSNFTPTSAQYQDYVRATIASNAESRGVNDAVAERHAAQVAAASPLGQSTDSNAAWAAAWKKMIESMIGTAGDVIAGIIGSPILKGWTLLLYSTKIALSAFLYISASLLDALMKITIENFRNIVEFSGVETGWAIIRNFINISFIFVLLYTSILMITGNGGLKTKSTIFSIIVAALLINFSLFFTRIFIDFGNFVAVALANKTGGALGTLSSLVVEGTGLTSVVWGLVKDWSLSSQTSMVSLLIFQIIIIATVGWAFLSAAFLFLGRMIMLMGLMILSPIGFIGDAVPGLKEKASEWRSSLIGQVMVAPIFLLFMVIVITMLKARESFDTIVTVAMKDNSGYGATGFIIGQFVFFIVIIAMLLAAVKITKKLSGSVGSFAEKLVQGIITLAVAAITGGAAMIAARGAGLAAGGAASVSRGRTMVARANALEAAGRATAATSAYAARGEAMIRSGSRQQRLGSVLNIPGQAGRALSGQALTQALGLPDVTGVMLKNAKEALLKSTKKETGLDLDSALKYNEKMAKEYEKRYGEMANAIGGKKEREELDVLNKISKNIADQAESRHKRDNRGAWERMEGMSGPAKDVEKARLLREAKTRYESAIAGEMGVDLSKHQSRKDELKIIIENKTVDKNRYANKVGRFNPKVAQKLRSEATYEAKDKVEDELAKLIKKLAPPAPPASGTTAP